MQECFILIIKVTQKKEYGIDKNFDNIKIAFLIPENFISSNCKSPTFFLFSSFVTSNFHNIDWKNDY